MSETINLERLKSTLRRHEQPRSKPYDDATGHELLQGDTLEGKLTIGIGRNLTDRGLSDEEQEMLLGNDIAAVFSELAACPERDIYADLNAVRREILLNMAFNMGVPRLRKFEKMWAALEEHNYPKAADEMMDSKWARQVGQRAGDLSTIMCTGVWPPF